MTKREQNHLDPTNWKLLDSSTYIEQLKDRKIPRKVIELHESLSQYDLYCYLKSRFGVPNGPMMMFRMDSSENLIQWQYILAVRNSDVTVEIMGMNTRVQFIFWNIDRNTKISSTDFTHDLKNRIASLGKGLARVRKQLDHYRIFTNPYVRAGEMAVSLETQILKTKSNLCIPKVAGIYANRAERESYRRDLQSFFAKTNKLSSACQSLKLILPIMGESFINLLIFILAKREIKSDDRLYKDLVAKNIDIRVKSLHLYCKGFRKPVDSSSDIFKKFHKLMNERNDIFHGNVDPSKQFFDEVYFDGKIPLFKKQMSFAERRYIALFNGIHPEQVLTELEDVRAFIVFIIDHLKSTYAEAVLTVMQDAEPGMNNKTGRVGVLFGVHLGDMF